MWLHTYQPEAILWQGSGVVIYWYGLLMMIAIVAGLAVTLFLSKRFQVDRDDLWDLAFWLVVGALIGARLYHVALEFSYYISHPVDIFKIWQGGIAIHGAWIGGLLVVWWWAKYHGYSLLDLLDLLVPGVALGQAIGRWGNYFNQELFGLPTNKPWGIPISPENRPPGFAEFTYFHPTFLYESLGNLLIFVILLWLIRRKKFSGQVFWHYLLFYSILRVVMESLRIDATLLVLGVRWPQLLSILLAVVAVLFLAKGFVSTRKVSS